MDIVERWRVSHLPCPTDEDREKPVGACSLQPTRRMCCDIEGFAECLAVSIWKWKTRFQNQPYLVLFKHEDTSTRHHLHTSVTVNVDGGGKGSAGFLTRHRRPNRIRRGTGTEVQLHPWERKNPGADQSVAHQVATSAGDEEKKKRVGNTVEETDRRYRFQTWATPCSPLI